MVDWSEFKVMVNGQEIENSIYVESTGESIEPKFNPFHHDDSELIKKTSRI